MKFEDMTEAQKEWFPPTVREAFEGQEIVGTQDFIIKVVATGDPDDPKTHVLVHPVGGEPHFLMWMVAAEYLLSLVASKSPAGYEAALESLMRGALTHRHVTSPQQEPIKTSNEDCSLPPEVL